MRKELKIMLGIGGIVLVVAGLLFWKGGGVTAADQAPTPDAGLLVRDASRMTGSRAAKVEIVEFGDYQCPACAKVEPLMKQLRKEFANNPNVNFVFRHFPLPQHENAIAAAYAAEAAGSQGKFWEMHELLYAQQGVWENMKNPEDVFIELAKNLGLDVGRFGETLQSGQYKSVVKIDADDGARLGVNSTPTIYINKSKLSGIPSSFEELKEHIDTLLRE